MYTDWNKVKDTQIVYSFSAGVQLTDWNVKAAKDKFQYIIKSTNISSLRTHKGTTYLNGQMNLKQVQNENLYQQINPRYRALASPPRASNSDRIGRGTLQYSLNLKSVLIRPHTSLTAFSKSSVF